VKEFILELYAQGLDNDQIEGRVIKYFKLKQGKKERQISSKHRKLDSMRSLNMRAKISHVHGFSEKAEMENLFIDCMEEYKKDITRKGRTQMAISSNM
jgi:hypothetical protein